MRRGGTTPPEDDVLSTPAAGGAAIRGGVLRVAGFAAASLLGLLGAAVLFRYLDHLDVSRYVTIIALVAIVSGVSDLGITQVGVRELSVTPPAERAGLARDLLGLRIVLSILGLAVMLVFALLAYSWIIAVGVAIAGAGLLLQAVQDNYSSILQVSLRFGWVAVLDVVRQLAMAVFIVFFVVAGAHLLAFVAVYVIAGVITASVAGALVRHERSLLPTLHRGRSRRLLVLVLPASAGMIAAVLYGQEGVVFVGLASNAHQLADYGAAFRVIQGLTMIPVLVMSSALPIFARAARDDHARFSYATSRVFDVAVIAGAGTAVALGVGAPLAITAIGGASYRHAADVLAILGVGLGAGFVGSLWGNALLSQGRYREMGILYTAGALALAPLVVLLASADGARGGATAAAAAEVVLAVVSGMLVWRAGRGRHPPLAVLPKTALAAGIAILPAFWTSAPDVVRLVLALALYAAVVLATRALPSELGTLLPARWRWAQGFLSR
jgi:O-antigen/teichoic acid export membrane protein